MKNVWQKMAVGASIGYIASVILFMGLVFAAPNTDFSWTEPTNYEDGTVIPGTDLLTYGLYCGTVQGVLGNFYGNIGVDTTIATAVDLNTCVNGIPGTYYFTLSAHSADFNAESGPSNEISKTYTAIDLGKVPLPPVLISVQ